MVNRVLKLRGKAESWASPEEHVVTPDVSVSKSEQSQINARLDGLAQKLTVRFLTLKLANMLIAQQASTYELPILTKPLRPVHICPTSSSNLESICETDYFPVICLSASRYTSGGSAERLDGFNYVPGSGDDHEAWAPQGFTPAMFWAHKAPLLAASKSDLPRIMQGMAKHFIRKDQPTGQNRIVWIGKTGIAISNEIYPKAGSQVYTVTLRAGQSDSQKEADVTSTTDLTVPHGSKGHLRFFTTCIGAINDPCLAALRQGRTVILQIDPLTGKDGEDLAVGIALTSLSELIRSCG